MTQEKVKLSAVEPRSSSDDLRARLRQAMALHQRGQLAPAMVMYEDILAREPAHFDALHLLGVACSQAGDNLRALQLIGQAIGLRPDNAIPRNNLGHALHGLKRFQEAVASYDRAIALKPDYAEAYNNRGVAQRELKQYEAAVQSYARALALTPEYPEAHYNRGIALCDLGLHVEALASFDRAIALRPAYVEAFHNRASTLRRLGRYKDAIADYDRAIELRPTYAEAYCNRGLSEQELRQHAQAVRSFEQAIALKPDYAEAYSYRANNLNNLHRYGDAIDSFDRLLELEPDYPYALGTRLHAQMHLCDWSDAPQRIKQLLEHIEAEGKVITPFAALALTDDPALQRQAAEIWARGLGFDEATSWEEAPPAPDGKIRIAYFSADFKNHPVAQVMAELLECHDLDRFEVYAFSYGPPSHDPIRGRLKRAVSRFVDVRVRSDKEIIAQARQLGIDIAIDLNGYTADCRSGIFAGRAAPVQVGYLGYPGTSGAPYIDYLVADHGVIPPDSRAHYSEKIAWLPECFFPYDTTCQPSERAYTRQELGLPEQGVVFCCFNNNYKILPEVFARWMRILRAVPGSVLWLREPVRAAMDNLRAQAERQGVEAARILFAPRVNDFADHLARYRQADLFLDTLPYNAHTTACDALWSGLPVLTCAGASFTARVAASLLQSLGLPELIADTPATYEARAIELAHQPERLQALRQQVAERRTQSPLFDMPRRTRQLEALFARMVQRHRQGLPPDDLNLDAAMPVQSAGSVVAGPRTPRHDPDARAQERALAQRFGRAMAMHQQGQLAQAVTEYEVILASQPDHFHSLHLLGVASSQLKDKERAVHLIEQALALRPDSPAAHCNMGHALHGLRRFQQAIEHYDLALELQPDYPEALNNRGVAQRELRQPQAALDSYARALALKPDYPEAYYNRGLALSDLKRTDEAIASYDCAIALKPDYAEAWCVRGDACNESKRYDAAVTSFDHALALRPGQDFARGARLYARRHACDWDGIEAETQQVLALAARGEKVCTPFSALSLSDDPALQLSAAQTWTAAQPHAGLRLPRLAPYPGHDRIRLGYFSMDLRNHPLSYVLGELFARHDRTRFEVIAFSYGEDTRDETRVRLETVFDQFLDVRQRTDDEIAALARSMEIDIAVDLAGYTAGGRSGIFARRAAPVQVSYMGFPGTQGADHIDYLVADPVLIPEQHQASYAEKIAYLPDSYWTYDTTRRAAARNFSRAELGLPEQGFVFCCFNNSYKISPDIFDIWMRLLARVPGSVLWLLQDTPLAADNLRRQAARRGIDPARLVFAPRMPLAEHLARHRAADLFLDTLPYNAHTTASDALLMGLPVLTCMGEAFASRVAGSLLNAVGLPDLIVGTLTAYEALAGELALQPERLAGLRAMLVRHVQDKPLFNAPRFARHIEAAYREMHERSQQGLPPAHIHVPGSL